MDQIGRHAPRCHPIPEELLRCVILFPKEADYPVLVIDGDLECQPLLCHNEIDHVGINETFRIVRFVDKLRIIFLVFLAIHDYCADDTFFVLFPRVRIYIFIQLDSHSTNI
jgi:hypothetical protein